MNLNSSFIFLFYKGFILQQIPSGTFSSYPNTLVSQLLSAWFLRRQKIDVFFFFFGASSFLTFFAMTLIYGAAAWVVVVFNKKYFPKNHKARPAFPDRRAAFHIESPAMPWPPISSIQRRSESSLISGRRLLSSLPVVLSLALWWHHQLAVALMGVFFPPCSGPPRCTSSAAAAAAASSDVLLGD